MATYDKYTLNLGPYQGGNIADEELTMDAAFPMTNLDVTMEVRDSSGRLIINKTTAVDGGIVIAGQVITISFSAAEMRRYGKFDYEIDFINIDSDAFATIGGTFTVNKEVNRS